MAAVTARSGHQGWAGPRTDRPVTLPLLPDDRLPEGFDTNDLDFYLKDHEYQRQEDEISYYLKLLWLAGGVIPVGLSVLRLLYERTVDTTWRLVGRKPKGAPGVDRPANGPVRDPTAFSG